jgi:Protein of unknown function (DUF2764)
MTKYYFLGCALPELSIEKACDISIDELSTMLEMNLSDLDLNKLNSVKFLNDLNNLKAFLLNEPIDTNGNFNATQLEDILLAKADLPDFAIDFLNKYESDQLRVKYFAELLANFFNWAITEFTGFLRKYFDFERKMRLSLAAIRAKRFNFNLEQEFQFEDLSDPFVAYLLAQKDLESIEPEGDFKQLLDIYNHHINDPMMLNKAIIEWKLNQIYAIEEQYPFQIDEILGYYIRLMLIEKWHKLNTLNNKDVVNQLSRE